MIRPPFWTRAAMWMLYSGLCALLMAIRLMPHNFGPEGWPAPDLMTCLTCAWLLRRPDQVPVLLVAAVFLTADLLLQRPPGLWTALMVLAGEVLRGRAVIARRLSLASEWALSAIVITAMSVLHLAVMAVTLVPQPPLLHSARYLAVTLLAYPVAMGLLRLAGVRRPDFASGIIRGSRA